MDRSSIHIEGGLLRRYGTVLRTAQQFLDISIALVVLYALTIMRHDGRYPSQYVMLAIVIALLMVVMYQASRAYQNQRFSGVVEDVQSLLRPWLSVVLTLILIGFVTKTSSLFSREVILQWTVLGYAAQVALHGVLRVAIRQARARNFNTRHVLLVGNRESAASFLRGLNRNQWLGINVVGFVDSQRRTETAETSQDSLHYLGHDSDIESIIGERKIDAVYLILPIAESAHVEGLTHRLVYCNVDVNWVPDISVFNLVHHGVFEIDGQPIISIHESPLQGSRRFVKWAEDIAFSVLFIIVFAIPMIAIAIAIKIGSRGPVIYRQRRHGLGGKIFTIWKFRTMADRVETPGRVTQATESDPRVTLLGHFLRRSSLDELPQVFNVMRGNMSIVGPRPHAVEHNDFYGKEIDAYMLRHKIKPGMTGWAQVHGLRGGIKNMRDMEKRVDHDLFYVNHWSLWLDLKILVMTVRSVLSGKSAY